MGTPFGETVELPAPALALDACPNKEATVVLAAVANPAARDGSSGSALSVDPGWAMGGKGRAMLARGAARRPIRRKRLIPPSCHDCIKDRIEPSHSPSCSRPHAQKQRARQSAKTHRVHSKPDMCIHLLFHIFQFEKVLFAGAQLGSGQDGRPVSTVRREWAVEICAVQFARFGKVA